MRKQFLPALIAAAVFALALAPVVPVRAAEEAEPPASDWPHKGPFGTFDRAALQRGFQVYREVCAACHSLRFVAFRNLTEIGFTTGQVKAIADNWDYAVATLDAEGEPTERQPLPSDQLVPPFPNAAAARAANGGANPPDLSLIVKARGGGEDYIKALLTGYADPPEGVELGDGLSYNRYFPGHQIAMPPPLGEDAVEYADGTPATTEQMADDVVSFLAWAAEPTLEARKRMGFKVVSFLVVLTTLLFFVMRRVWADQH